MMANSWKTKDDIMADYQYSESSFYERCADCENYPEYQEAIIHDGKHTYVVEPLFQEYLKHKSEQRRLKRLDPHLRK